MTERAAPVSGIAVSKLSMDGHELAQYPSIKKAAAENGVPAPLISRVCKGLAEQAGGYRWRCACGRSWEEARREMYRKRRGVPLSGPSETQRQAVQKAVVQYTLDMKFVREYPSLKAAAESIGLSWVSISWCCDGRRKTAGGYVWRLAETTSNELKEK